MSMSGSANIAGFTTGRGSVFGCNPMPNLKQGTTAQTYESLDEVGRRLLGLIIDTAPGRKSKSEERGSGGEELTPWQLGAVI